MTTRRSYWHDEGCPHVPERTLTVEGHGVKWRAFLTAMNGDGGYMFEAPSKREVLQKAFALLGCRCGR